MVYFRWENESHGCNNCSTGRYGDVSGSPTIEIGCPDFARLENMDLNRLHCI